MASVKRDISAPERLQLDRAETVEDHAASTSSSEKSSSRASSSTPETPQDESFKCSGHAERSLKRMDEFLQANQLTDITLLAGSEHIPAHRLVLSASSSYFAAMFGGGLRESSQTEVEMHDVTEACGLFLEKRLHPSNCIGISLFADTQNCLGLLEKARTYTAEHFMEVVGHQEFLQLGAEQVGCLLACNDLNVPSEQDILQALVSWVKHSPETRQENVGALLAHVKLPLLSPSFIADHVEAEPLFANDNQCRELVMEAMKFHLLPERRATLASPRTCPRKSTVGSMEKNP
ncbi:hypothetical protein B566_EDAN009185 [Ephemera danica]|nr:hypothetical protein B566_EDAN009185 [Ephemera danica]